MPSKKRKYNARFPAGRIKKIMQTDEEVGKVAQAVPIIISRTLELFVESLLSKAMQVTVARNAKTLSPSHVKQCILAESRFDFLTDLVKNIPDVSAAEEKEIQMSAESSPNSSRFSDTSAPPRKIVREDSNSSSSCDVKVQLPREPSRETLKRVLSADVETKPKTETATSTVISTDAAIDLTIKKEDGLTMKKEDGLPIKKEVGFTIKTEDGSTVRTANFYQETLVDQVQQYKSVIKLNPTYASPQPSTSSYASLTAVEPVQRIEVPIPATPKPEGKPFSYLGLKKNNVIMTPPRTPVTPTTPAPITPILNIDFSKNLANPEIKVLDTAVANIVGVRERPKLQRQNSKALKSETKRDPKPPPPLNIDIINSGNLQIDEDYDT